MARLKQSKDGWQWDDGLVLEERWLAVKWGQAVVQLEQLKELHELTKRQDTLTLEIKRLEKLR